MSVVVIHGSPSEPSRSSALAYYLSKPLEQQGITVHHVTLTQLPADALLRTDTAHPKLSHYLELIANASGIIIATPVYTGSISALTKALLEIIPERGLRGRPALAVASGGSVASVQAAEHALTPILRNLKATLIGASVYSTASELPSRKDSNGYTLDYQFTETLTERLDDALEHFVAQLPPTHTRSSTQQHAWAARLAL
ncbi:NAD(P)H-dependent oxidoreductase [Carnimonas bestiolae]|uniref:NAD(P)H-dependent oxidoreductase n=1 Tax=Carnimonas bestiolae TaxID=3402172 RepID=UPI003EDBA1D5